MNEQHVTETFFAAFYNANDAVRARELVLERVAPTFIDHSPVFGATPDKAGFAQTVAFINTVFRQDYHVTKLITQGDLYVGIWQAEVTHVGELLGVPATTRTFAVTGITIYQIEGNYIVAHWEQFDVAGILRAIGILQ